MPNRTGANGIPMAVIKHAHAPFWLFTFVMIRDPQEGQVHAKEVF
jgi:hypothetical protein